MPGKPRPDEHGFTEMRLHGGEVILKRRHPIELFERYDLATGAAGNVARMDHERLAISFPRATWIAGESMPFTIDFSSGSRAIKPASTKCTPSESRACATRSFSSTESDIPSPPMPSRSVVS